MAGQCIIDGSSQISDAFFIRAEYQDYDFDFDIDGNIFEFGAGYFHTLNGQRTVRS